MIEKTIIVDNLKCGGCANTIRTKIEKIEDVSSANVNVETSEVSVQYSKNDTITLILGKLKSLGYPEAGTSNGIQKAKSYLSCAIGKMS